MAEREIRQKDVGYGDIKQALIIVAAGGSEKRVEAETGELLSSVLRLGGAHIDMPCAGAGFCKGCTVLVNGVKRLACQTRIDGDARVELGRASALEGIAVGNMAAKPVNPVYSRYGAAIDIGTTTVCVALLGADGSGDTLTLKNPQTRFGADVISRIERAIAGELEGLSQCIRGALGEMIGALADRNDINPTEIDGLVITGNTAMLYLLMGHNPKALSHAPFQADRLFGETLDGSSALTLSSEARIYLPRCISAFVGGDITTAVMASGMCQRDKTTLLADIGTNGEIALWHNGELKCCSTAAGPAFEGVGITHGVYGVSGAIDRVWEQDGTIRCSTIGGAPAVGICGSGVIDALAVMLKRGDIDETGLIEGGSGYIELQKGIGVTQADVRKIQLAKGSIRAGIETLLETRGVRKSEVDAFYIAGGFGSYLDLRNAAAIGLIPPELLPRARVIGNAAHTGAVMLLQNQGLIEESETIAKQAGTIGLDGNPVFTEYYMSSMMFE